MSIKYNMCGKILKTHGLQGEVKILNSSDFPRFEVGKKVYYKEDDKYIELIIAEVRDTKDLLVKFRNYNDINLILPLVGKDLYAKREKNDLLDNEYYYTDLIGKDIYNEDNILRTKVSNIREYPQGKYLVCRIEDKVKLIPFRQEFIVDVLEDRIIIKEIDGLL